MGFSASRALRIVAVAAGVTLAVSGVLWAGGSGFDDEHEPEEDAGPAYFGFVKDTRGSLVASAKVTVGVKGGGSVVTQTNILGAFKVPGFNKDIDPKTVEISCAKVGYKQLRVMTRPRATEDPKIPIESECILQRV
ncbi:MAG: hypothetical protein ACRECO_22750 [Xanthobacteraceae bacterium]